MNLKVHYFIPGKPLTVYTMNAQTAH